METVYRDTNIIAVNKPAGLVVYSRQPGVSLMQQLVELLPDLTEVGRPPRYGLVHRLDKETSGIILIARNKETLKFLQKQFQERSVEKRYLGLIYGQIKPPQGRIESYLTRSPQDFRRQKSVPLGPNASGRLAQTDYQTLKTWTGYSLLEIRPKTGRIHQIRAQLSWKGHPIVGDRLYQFKNQSGPDCLSRMFLHSYSISLTWFDQKIKTFQAPLPEELEAVLKCLDQKQHVTT